MGGGGRRATVNTNLIPSYIHRAELTWEPEDCWLVLWLDDLTGRIDSIQNWVFGWWFKNYQFSYDEEVKSELTQRLV